MMMKDGCEDAGQRYDRRRDGTLAAKGEEEDTASERSTLAPRYALLRTLA